MKAIILAAFLALSACVATDQARDLVIGPAATAPTQVYRVAGEYLITLNRLNIGPAAVVTPRIRLANQKADGAMKEAYAAVSMSNAPPDLRRKLDDARAAVILLASTAKITELAQNPPSLDPIGIAGWMIGKALDAGPIMEMYQAELEKLNSGLVAFYTEGRDPTQAEWDALWADVTAAQERMARR